VSKDLDQTLKTLRIRDLFLPEPLIVAKGDKTREVLAAMQDHRRSCALICQDKKVIGLFTERDVLNRITSGEADLDGPIDDVMTAGPKTLGMEDIVGSAIRMMTEEGHRHVPLVDEAGLAVGLLTARDLLTYIAENYPAEILNLPPHLHQKATRAEGG
jgi:CBS domain-containing protein